MKRGFSLIEVVVVIAIVAIIAAVAIGMLSRGGARADLADAAREFQSRMAQARQMVATGQRNIPSWGPTEKVVNAGIRLISNTQYAVFVDRDDTTDGDEVDMEVVDLPPEAVRIVTPAAPAEIRLRGNGTLTGAQVDVLIRNNDGKEKTVRVSVSGTSRIL
jgi:prepilin-type N-terminal cleavage/methylation domain-containing protein